MADTKKVFEFLHARQEFVSSESYSLIQILKENRLLISVLRDNYIELAHLIEHHNTVLKSLLQSDPSKRWKLQLKIIRYLTNYLNSLYNFIEYSRKNLLHLLHRNDIILKRYEEYKEYFITDDYHHFIMNLRTYSTHNTYLKVGSQYSLNIQWEGPRKEIYLERDILLEWDGWNLISRKFLQKQEAKIYIRPIIESHFLKFVAFQNFTFLNLLLVDESKTSNMIRDVEIIIQKANNAKVKFQLPFKDAYLRYLQYLHKKAKSLEKTTQ